MARYILIEPSDLAYAAGFFDGEGCVSAQTVKTQYGVWYYPGVQVAQKYGNILRWHQEKWGGNILTKPTYEKWSLASKAAREFLADIQPYLKCKKAQVDFVLEHAKPSLTLEQCETLKELKRKESYGTIYTS